MDLYEDVEEEGVELEEWDELSSGEDLLAEDWDEIDDVNDYEYLEEEE